MWVNTCCASYSTETSIETYSSTCATICSSTSSFVISPPFKSVGELDWTSWTSPLGPASY